MTEHRKTPYRIGPLRGPDDHEQELANLLECRCLLRANLEDVEMLIAHHRRVMAEKTMMRQTGAVE